ncbi:hypothetical protein E2N92_04005 [Methanofollis formosanus]|uniref:Uncharacterized protein n=1 Tax=Methanofollis formosanus TaxID=299308 RepID=A0A8G1EFD1_9EURY|nr:hypothetical protein [Methanofollis formosanus]QYZ78645.1 hypothetical protein E2N92_04005 [Methanofollis formosanus]
MIPFDPLLAPAVVLGMAGAVLVACRSARVRTAGFGVWVCGNMLWVAYGFWSGNVYVTVMFTFYAVTAGVGMVNAGEKSA